MEMSCSFENLSSTEFHGKVDHDGFNSVTSFTEIPPDTLLSGGGQGTLAVSQDFLSFVGQSRHSASVIWSVPGSRVEHKAGWMHVVSPISFGIRLNFYPRVAGIGRAPDWSVSAINDTSLEVWETRSGSDCAQTLILESFRDFDVQIAPTASHSELSLRCLIVSK